MRAALAGLGLLFVACASSSSPDAGADAGPCKVTCPGPDACDAGEHVESIFICGPHCEPAGCCQFADCECRTCAPNDGG